MALPPRASSKTPSHVPAQWQVWQNVACRSAGRLRDVSEGKSLRLRFALNEAGRWPHSWPARRVPGCPDRP